MAKLEGKTIIITGGARGMGEVHARTYVEDGARIVIADVLEDEGKALASELGGHALFTRLDVSSEESWSTALDAAHHEFGPVSGLVNNAGVEVAAPLHECTSEQFDWVIGVNLKGAFLGIKAVMPDMIAARSGAIVNIGSGAGLIGFENMSIYSSAKAGMNGLTKSAAIDYGRYGVRVNALHPGVVKTPMLEEAMDSNADLKEVLLQSVKFQAIPRMGERNELAAAASFLLSDDASYVTGTAFPVDGGLILGSATPQS